jgi:16S rRNA (adenine1518-N6/adenine1519-N6)-dimethyltransferase
VLLERRPPPVRVDEDALRTVVRESFAQRRKTMRSALVRLGLARERANELLAGCDVRPEARPEELALEDFACLANGVARAGEA